MKTSERKRLEAMNAGLESCPRQVSDEKVHGLLENVFGLKLPKKLTAQPRIDEEKVADTLINVFGVKLPSEMVPNAYTIFLTEHNR